MVDVLLGLLGLSKYYLYIVIAGCAVGAVLGLVAWRAGWYRQSRNRN